MQVSASARESDVHIEDIVVLFTILGADLVEDVHNPTHKRDSDRYSDRDREREREREPGRERGGHNDIEDFDRLSIVAAKFCRELLEKQKVTVKDMTK